MSASEPTTGWLRAGPYRAQLARFALSGGAGSLVFVGTLTGLNAGLGLADGPSAHLAFIAALAWNYLAHRGFSFRSHRSHRSALPRFLASSAVGYALYSAIVFGMLKAGAGLGWACTVAVPTVIAANFALLRSLVFGAARSR
jgi:putative flippase GtrA